MSTKEYEHYYVPAQSKWPIIGAVGLFFIVIGAASLVNSFANDTAGLGGYGLTLGLAIIIFMVFGWFKQQIEESMSGLYSAQLGVSYRQGMAWFIFSEVMFFAAFFGALFYARQLSVPCLAGEGNNAMTGEVLWNGFQNIWPLEKMPDGRETKGMAWTGLPLINTVLLLTSSVTLHFAHVGIEQDKRGQAKVMMGITILLGLAFLFFQVEEYIEAYHMGLTLDSGIYGSTFFLLTGFHGMHVTLGTIMLIVMFFRILKGHFTHDNHFAFLAASWYWHFVDVVWLGLFIFVYIL
ncbi:MAG: cytochrome c oxidase subunit 3 [Psychrosphaera sp.]|nr:cytochrome c oxidase subunit 3 [Psychrosphaera sp.]